MHTDRREQLQHPGVYNADFDQDTACVHEV